MKRSTALQALVAGVIAGIIVFFPISSAIASGPSVEVGGVQVIPPTTIAGDGTKSPLCFDLTTQAGFSLGFSRGTSSLQMSRFSDDRCTSGQVTLAQWSVNSDATSAPKFVANNAAGVNGYECLNVGCRLQLGDSTRYLYDDGTQFRMPGNLKLDQDLQARYITATAAVYAATIYGNITGGSTTIQPIITSGAATSTVPALKIIPVNALDTGDLVLDVQKSDGTSLLKTNVDGTTTALTDVCLQSGTCLSTVSSGGQGNNAGNVGTYSATTDANLMIGHCRATYGLTAFTCTNWESAANSGTTGTPSVAATGQYEDRIWLKYSTSTANTTLGAANSTSQGVVMLGWSATTTFKTWIKSTARNTAYRYAIGLVNTPSTVIASDAPTNNGAWFAYRTGTTDTKWMCCSSDGVSAATCTSSNTDFALSSNYLLQIDIQPDSRVTYYINGTSVCTRTTNIPTTANADSTETFSPMMYARTGGTAEALDLFVNDYTVQWTW